MRFSTLSRSISDSINSIRCSARFFTSDISRTFCFSSSFSEICAAMVSANRLASSMPEIVDSTSPGTFLDNWTYCSKLPVNVRTSTSFSRSDSASVSEPLISPRNNASSSIRLSSSARLSPSTRTLTVPSGNLSSWRIVATVPIACMVSIVGSSSDASVWATSMMRLSDSIASSRALIDFSRPTNRGITIAGNTTTSRNGNNGSVSVDIDT